MQAHEFYKTLRNGDLTFGAPAGTSSERSSFPLYRSRGSTVLSSVNMRNLRKKGTSGQTMLEFIIVAVVFLSVLVMLSIFLYTFKEYGGRILDLVASEYP